MIQTLTLVKNKLSSDTRLSAHVTVGDVFNGMHGETAECDMRLLTLIDTVCDLMRCSGIGFVAWYRASDEGSPVDCISPDNHYTGCAVKMRIPANVNRQQFKRVMLGAVEKMQGAFQLYEDDPNLVWISLHPNSRGKRGPRNWMNLMRS